MKKMDFQFPRKMLIAGSVFLVTGGALLLRTTGFLTAPFAIWPIAVMFAGLFLLHRVFFKNGADSQIFYGIFLILVGAFLLVLNTGMLESDFRQFWPLFMLFAGVSLFFFSLKKADSARLRMLIPAAAIIVLSLFFLLFSLQIVSISLRSFVIIWWPGIMVFAGITLIVFDIIINRGNRKR